MQVPAGHVWLQGDNTLSSTDSRHCGPVPYALVNAKAFLKVCPPGQLHTLVGYSHNVFSTTHVLGCSVCLAATRKLTAFHSSQQSGIAASAACWIAPCMCMQTTKQSATWACISETSSCLVVLIQFKHTAVKKSISCNIFQVWPLREAGWVSSHVPALL